LIRGAAGEWLEIVTDGPAVSRDGTQRTAK
jgi:hypothetical protein